MALRILVDESLRRGVPLQDALESYERVARINLDETEEQRVARRNRRMMEKFERG